MIKLNNDPIIDHNRLMDEKEAASLICYSVRALQNWRHRGGGPKFIRVSSSIWFDAEMAWEAKPSGHRGRQQAYSDAAIQACLTIKVLFGLPLRQATGFVERLLELAGLDWTVPDFSTLCRQGHAKHDPERGINEETLEIRAIEVTSSSIGDAPMLPELLEQVPPDEEIGADTADGAYDTRKCHDAIAARKAHAVIPPRKNAKLWKPPFRACRHALSGSGHAGSQGAKRSGSIIKISGASTLATADRIPPPKPH